MTLLRILILALVQGAAELLPVSSSAHVIVAEKLMGMDPTRPEMTLLLVMLHTGTMFAVVVFFWSQWRARFGRSGRDLMRFVKLLAVATLLTGVVGLLLKQVIERVFLRDQPHAEVENLFGNLTLISIALAAAGILIIIAGLRDHKRPRREGGAVDLAGASWMGLVQGVCLPFRGFSRSGATISTGLLRGLSRTQVEEFSFAMAVVLTPPVIVREVLRMLRAHQLQGVPGGLVHLFVPSLLGMVMAFGSGLLALKWLSAWLERGRWHLFGAYCICASMVVFVLSWSTI
jgi:undecaprenyl-diphosphatase